MGSPPFVQKREGVSVCPIWWRYPLHPLPVTLIGPWITSVIAG